MYKSKMGQLLFRHHADGLHMLAGGFVHGLRVLNVGQKPTRTPTAQPTRGRRSQCGGQCPPYTTERLQFVVRVSGPAPKTVQTWRSAP